MLRIEKKSSINKIVAIVTCSGTNVIVEFLGTITGGRAGAVGTVVGLDEISTVYQQEIMEIILFELTQPPQAQFFHSRNSITSLNRSPG